MIMNSPACAKRLLGLFPMAQAKQTTHSVRAARVTYVGEKARSSPSAARPHPIPSARVATAHMKRRSPSTRERSKGRPRHAMARLTAASERRARTKRPEYGQKEMAIGPTLVLRNLVALRSEANRLGRGKKKNEGQSQKNRGRREAW